MLETRNLTVEFDGEVALLDVSAHFETGKNCAIFGANGAGKTTLLKAITGFVPVAGGEILYGGEEITSLPTGDRVRMGIQYIPDDARVGMRMTIEENLRIGGFLRRKKEVSRALGEVFDLFPDLAEKKNSPAQILSGGQRQMLVIGRAYVSSPRFMLFDEPLFGLSRSMREVIVNLLKELSKGGTTLIIAEHDVEEILPVADTYLILSGGEIVSRGEVDRRMGVEEFIDILKKYSVSRRTGGEKKRGG